MWNKKNNRAITNLALLEGAARKLGKLNEAVVYLGGCATALLITDPLSLDIRPTFDVDCIIDVISLVQYHHFEKALNQIGFRASLEDDVICRFRCNEIILDVMPTDEKILGFGNLWYKEALDHAITYQINEDLIVKAVSAPYFLATKIEAFNARGNNDLWASHDFEDIITVIAGRKEIANETALGSDALKSYLKSAFEKIVRNDQFEQVLPGHLNDGLVTMQRVQTVKERINQIIDHDG